LCHYITKVQYLHKDCVTTIVRRGCGLKAAHFQGTDLCLADLGSVTVYDLTSALKG